MELSISAARLSNTMFVDELENFLDAIFNNKEPINDIHNSLQGLETTVSIKKYIDSK